MALKRKITEAEYAALSDALKNEYVKDGDVYVLDMEDTGFDALKAERELEKARREAAEAALQKIKDDAAEASRKAAEDAAKASGDIAALEKSWKAKSEADLAAEKANTEKATAAVRSLLVDTAASQMANEISIVPGIMAREIARRMTVEFNGAIPVLRILSKEGHPSALSVADLKKEFLDNPEYSGIIKGTGASGGGANGGGSGGGTAKKKLSEMSGLEEAKFANEHPEEYEQLLRGK